MTTPSRPRRRAAVAGHTGDASAARSLLGDHDPHVRATALGALERLGTLDAATLLGATLDASAIVRRRAAELGAGHGDVSLIGLLDDPDDAVIEAAAWASGERCPPEPGVVARLSELATAHRDPLVREAAIAALGAIGDVAALPAILAGTRDKPAVRRRAVIALAPFDGPAVDEALNRARDDRDWQVRQAAEDLRC